jgi:glycosyltransferase involved in cell wall biosynthesis
LGDIDVQHTPIRPLLPVSNDDVANLRRQLGIEAGTRVVLAVGRLSKEKGHADMIRAIDEIRRREPGLPVRALILGEGPEGARLERLCLELNLTANVSLLGFRTDTRAFYALADLLVLPSHSEGSPNVLLEAIAARLLVVATAVGGVPEMVSHEKEALLVPARDVPALALGIVRGLTDGALRDRACLASPDILNRHLPEDYFRSIRSILLNTITTYSESAI